MVLQHLSGQTLDQQTESSQSKAHGHRGSPGQLQSCVTPLTGCPGAEHRLQEKGPSLSLGGLVLLGGSSLRLPPRGAFVLWMTLFSAASSSQSLPRAGGGPEDPWANGPGRKSLSTSPGLL